jgi:uncharacterized protein YndB with AHSA1/START domain
VSRTPASLRKIGLLVALGATACGAEPRVSRIPDPDRAELWSIEVKVNAPPRRVWEVLTDFEAYSQWNPWLIEAHGHAAVGERVDVQVVLGSQTRTARHRVYAVEPARRLCWRDAGATTLFATGSRCRVLEPDGAGGTVLRVELHVGGAFRRTARRKYGAAIRRGLDAETEALRRQAEGQ